MSDRDEAVEAMAKALHEIACPCDGWPCQWEHDPSDPTDEAAEVSMARYRRDAPRMLRYLAAAGYTVTKDRFEPEVLRCHECGTTRGKCRDGQWLAFDHEYFCEGRNEQTLYRKIEGSTDGADRE